MGRFWHPLLGLPSLDSHLLHLSVASVNAFLSFSESYLGFTKFVTDMLFINGCNFFLTCSKRFGFLWAVTDVFCFRTTKISTLATALIMLETQCASERVFMCMYVCVRVCVCMPVCVCLCVFVCVITGIIIIMQLIRLSETNEQYAQRCGQQL